MRLGDGLTPHEADELQAKLDEIQAKLDELETQGPGGTAAPPSAFRPHGTVPTAADLPGIPMGRVAVVEDRTDDAFIFEGTWISLKSIGGLNPDGVSRSYASDVNAIDNPVEGDFAMTGNGGANDVAYELWSYAGGEWADTGLRGVSLASYDYLPGNNFDLGEAWVTEDTASLWVWDKPEGYDSPLWTEYPYWKAGVRAAVPANFPVAVTSVEVAGDSWTAGFGATATAYGYAERLAKLLGVALTNIGQSGGVASGLASEGGVAKILHTDAMIPLLTAGPYFAKGGLKVAQVGYNDATALGMNAETAAVVESALTAFYAALRAARHLPFDNAALSYSNPAPAPDATLGMGNGYVYMTADGQWAQLALDEAYAGDPITVLIPHHSVFATSGVLTAVLDPEGAATVIGTYDGPTIDGALKAVGRSGIGCLRIPRDAVPHGANVIRLEVSGLDGSNFATFGGAIIEGKAPLLLPLYKTQDSSLDEQVAWVNERIAAVAALFDNVLTVDLAGVLGDPRFFADVAHPNNLGNARVAGALLAALPQILTAENCGEMN